jgi:cellulose synthase/poly-beta-1,6-N-acetylglucosamine synthase-like glycosyltransferase
MNSKLPFISVIIPCRNELKYIKKCLESILYNDYPKIKIEIIIVDGGSDDGTKNIINSYIKKYPFIRLLDNPKKITPAAMNIGIGEAKGDIIVRMDAHSIYEKEYISNSVDLLQTTNASMVGGVRKAKGTGFVSKAIALATTTPFGIGDSKYLYSNKEEWVDTVFAGTWYKKTLKALGGFNEEWVVNQDYELNYRLRQAGGKILLSPKIRCYYYVRDSLTKLAKQYLRYGTWRVKTLVTYPDSLRARQLAPPVFVLSLIISLIILPFSLKYGIILLLVYGISNIGVSLKISIKKKLKYLPILPIIFFILHLAWGLGFIFGLKRFGVPQIGIKQIFNSLKNVK